MREIPLVDAVANDLAVRLVIVLDRVVDDAEVETHAGDAASNTRAAIASFFVDDLKEGGGSDGLAAAGLGQASIGIQLLIELVVDDPLARAAHLLGQVCGMRAGNYM